MNTEEREAAIAHRAEVSGDPVRLWVKGAFRRFDVYLVPVDLLQLNADNRRFRAEKLQWEEELERPLDPAASEDDELSVISILLDENQQIADGRVQGKMGKDAQALIDDWQTRGQENPLWIRPNGWVTNGNRRLAALKRLAREHGSATGRFSFVNVIILPWDDYDDNDLFEMEAREQLTEGLKRRYTDINLLLTLREAAERHGIDWSDDASIVSAASAVQDLVGNNPKYAEVQLFAVKYMDEYLDYAEQPGLYHHLIGQVERFRDIGKNMVRLKRDSPEEAGDFLLLQFQGVQAGLGHMQMRALRQIAIDDPDKIHEVFDEVQKTIERRESDPVSPETPPTAPVEPELPYDEEDEEDSEESDSPPVSAPPGFPARDVRRILEVAIEERRAMARNDAEFTLRSVAKQLQQVTKADVAALRDGPNAAAVNKAISEIRTWLEDASANE